MLIFFSCLCLFLKVYKYYGGYDIFFMFVSFPQCINTMGVMIFFSCLCLFLKVYKYYVGYVTCIICKTSADIHVCFRAHTKILLDIFISDLYLSIVTPTKLKKNVYFCQKQFIKMKNLCVIKYDSHTTLIVNIFGMKNI